jgi:hypothetical protein
VHFHVVNWSVECAACLAECGPGVSASTEAYRYERDITFFATARFNRAAQVMAAAGCPLYIVDLDVQFTRAPDVGELSDFTIAYRFGGGEDWFPWWGPTAKYVFLNNTSRGQETAELMHRYFNGKFRPNCPRETWWFDQLMLNEIGYLLRTNGRGTEIGNIKDTRTRFVDDLPAAATENKRSFAERSSRKGRQADGATGDEPSPGGRAARDGRGRQGFLTALKLAVRRMWPAKR